MGPNKNHNLFSYCLRINRRISCIHHNPRHILNFIVCATLVPFQKPLQLGPRLRFMPSITATTIGDSRPTALQPPAPLRVITRAALHDDGKRTGQACQRVEVSAARQWGVDDDRQTEPYLALYHPPQHSVGEVVEHPGSNQAL
jgi:hypothetical protein